VLEMVEELRPKVNCATIVLQPWIFKSEERPPQYVSLKIPTTIPKFLRRFLQKLAEMKFNSAIMLDLNTFRESKNLPLLKNWCLYVLKALLLFFPFLF
jgi:hypothetical protein